jgi:serine/threonine-protein kinase
MNTEVIRKDWVGSVVNEKYRLVEWLGSFGQAGVYLCEIQGNAEQKAAIKLFPAAVEGAAACAAGWTTAAGLSHPHLIRVLDTGRGQIDGTGVLYVVTEYAGEVLSEILTERPLTPDEVKQMLWPVLDVLEYLHEDGLVHARLKPSNIMVIDDELKLSSENIRGAAAAFTPPKVLETYDAPEKSQGRISPATDMWSLGVTLVEALTRIPPAWNRTGQIEPLVPPSVPEPFIQIARECLRLEPANRCTLDEVRACLHSGAAIPHRPIKPKTKLTVVGGPITTRRNLVVAGVALTSLIAIVAIVAHHKSSPPVPATSDQTTSAPVDGQPSATPEAAPSQPVPQAQAPAPQAAPAQSAPLPATTQPQPAPNPAEATPTPVQAPPPSAVQATPQAAMQAPPSAPVKTTPPTRAASGPAAKGAVTQKVMPDVPERASRTIHGTVKVGIRVNVEPSGSVGGASIDSQGPSKYFANLALDAARSWKFEPAQANGQSVASVWVLQFEFRQDGTEVTPTEQSP